MILFIVVAKAGRYISIISYVVLLIFSIRFFSIMTSFFYTYAEGNKRHFCDPLALPLYAYGISNLSVNHVETREHFIVKHVPPAFSCRLYPVFCLIFFNLPNKKLLFLCSLVSVCFALSTCLSLLGLLQQNIIDWGA